MTNDFNNSYTSESSRCLHCAKPTCREACPLNNDVPRFLQLVSDGKFDEAVQVVGHPFGEICGFVCPHDAHCHGGCVLSKRGRGVKMGEVERAVFAQHPYKVERKTLTDSKKNGLKVAVVGGGVSGLTCAVKLFEQGADVTVFERDELLSTLKLIPDFRLPKEAIERVLNAVDGKFKVVKKDVNFDDMQLTDLYDAVYVATGASQLYTLGVEGEEFATPYDEFLRSDKHCGRVVVIGGGNTAMDCARLAKRSGCEVTVAYRRTRDDMPAFNKEIEDAYGDGVKFEYNLAPIKLEQKDGKLLLTLAKTVSEGRGKLTVTDETVEVECDTVVSALGSRFDKKVFGSQGDTFNQDNPRNPQHKLYVGGDALRASTVVNAVADGLKAAKEILCLSTK